MYASKFTHISPVWYDIGSIPGSSISSYMIMGDNEVQKEWIDKVREKNDKIKIIPRYNLKMEDWSIDSIEKFLKKKKKQKEYVSTLLKSLKKASTKYDGCVLEISPFLILFHKNKAT